MVPGKWNLAAGPMEACLYLIGVMPANVMNTPVSIETSGRIYKIIHQDGTPSPKKSVNMSALTPTELVGRLGSRNNWFVRQSRLELARRHAQGGDLSNATERLRTRFASSRDEQQAVQTLLTLHVVGGADDDFLRVAN